MSAITFAEKQRLMWEREDQRRAERIAECGSEEEWWRQFDERLREGERKEEERARGLKARLTRGIGYTILWTLFGLSVWAMVGAIGLVPALLVFLVWQQSAILHAMGKR